MRVTVDGYLAGNAIACRWMYEKKTVCWVTQLVVHQDYRERGLAMGLLNQLRHDDDDIYGLMSSHPAACLAAAKAFGSECTSLFVLGSNAEHFRFYQHSPARLSQAVRERYHESFPDTLCQRCQTLW